MKKTVYAVCLMALLVGVSLSYVLWGKGFHFLGEGNASHENVRISNCYFHSPALTSSSSKSSPYSKLAKDVYQNIKKFVVNIDYGDHFEQELEIYKSLNSHSLSSCEKKYENAFNCALLIKKYNYPYYPLEDFEAVIRSGINRAFGACSSDIKIVFGENHSSSKENEDDFFRIQILFPDILENDSTFNVVLSRKGYEFTARDKEYIRQYNFYDIELEGRKIDESSARVMFGFILHGE